MKADLMRVYENGKIAQLEIQIVAENMYEAFFMGETATSGGIAFPEVTFLNENDGVIEKDYPPKMLITLRKNNES